MRLRGSPFWPRGQGGPSSFPCRQGRFETIAGSNLAREPRDVMTVDTAIAEDAAAPVPANFGADQWRAAGAVLRAASAKTGEIMAGPKVSVIAQYP
jgi:hypothetical protein